MHKFYFNECLPAPVSQAEFIVSLSETLYEFNLLYKKNIGIEPAIITLDMPSACFFGNEFTLQNSIEELPNTDLKKVAFAYFYKYPIGAHFDETHEDLFKHEYTLSLGEREVEAVNLAVVKLNSGFLFTLGLHEVLRRHPLNIGVKSDSKIQYSVNNLYGESKNTKEIEEIIVQLNRDTLNSFEKLKDTIGGCIVSRQFEKSFGRLTTIQQLAIIERFERAKKRPGPSPFFPDNDLIKEVKANKKKCTIYELRIFADLDMRVYFHEGAKIYLGEIGFKNQDNQDMEIIAAQNILNKLTIVNT